ncbi:hypothetical protein K474DRAFT_1679878 [Panus rudis PR-1116 ss-1]|nr:hypothetical protein K474DRAFT_1679878 [Panus rudis PR-1116 ss-1]
MEPTFSDAEQLHALSESTTHIEDVDVNAMIVELSDEEGGFKSDTDTLASLDTVSDDFPFLASLSVIDEETEDMDDEWETDSMPSLQTVSDSDSYLGSTVTDSKEAGDDNVDDYASMPELHQIQPDKIIFYSNHNKTDIRSLSSIKGYTYPKINST